MLISASVSSSIMTAGFEEMTVWLGIDAIILLLVSFDLSFEAFLELLAAAFATAFTVADFFWLFDVFLRLEVFCELTRFEN